MLVEDDYLDVKSIQRLLNKHKVDHTLHIAHNGVDALAMLTGNSESDAKVKPDILLLDINMPKMNGIEFLRIIRNYYTFSTIKIFIMTTSSEEYDKIAAQNLGVDGYIIKPFDFTTSPGQDSSQGSMALLTKLLLA
jgi:CheY-like chemotaxis protein